MSAPFTNDLRKLCNTRLNELEQRRHTVWTRWVDLQLNIDPKRGSFNQTAASQQSKLAARDQKIKDSTARDALRTMQSGLMSGATSPSRPWIKLGLNDEELAGQPAVKRWLSTTQKRILHVIADSNIYTSLHNLYGDLGLFGTAGFLLLEDFEDVVRAYPLVIGEFFIGLDKRLAVNTLYRKMSMTVRQLVDEFGLANCSQAVKSAYDYGQVDTEFDVVHAIEPNDQRIIKCADAKGMPFREVYFEAGNSEGFLRVSGHREFPALIPRWDVNGSDAWGTGPGMDALPDVKQLAAQTVFKGKAISKQVDPPMTGPASLKSEPATILPGGLTITNDTEGKNGFRPAYQPNVRLADLTADIELVKRSIKTAFFADLFFAISQMEGVQPRNNQEIIERKDEKLVQLGPVLERLHRELLGPLVLRVYRIMDAAGLIPPKPPEMGDMSIKVEFVSVLAQAQKSVATAGIERYVQFVGELAEAFPEATAKVDIYEVLDDYADLLNINPKMIRTNDAAHAILDGQAKKAQQDKMLEAAPGLAKGASDLAGAMPGGGINAMNMMTGAV